ncbi:MAG TPA: methylmalonyl Co-A mutase-associated GTPase MeaB [Puia sp.]|jgi:LAO/AO transport system kinase|nr:methylmalonyl Co-A mutase-associated GTPase MeaB [Puia sp.]
MWQQLAERIHRGDTKAIARGVSLIENAVEGYEELLQGLRQNSDAKVIGVTGPPGAGKSTLVDVLIGLFIKNKKKVAVLCVDPSSPFSLGALLGDRIRMNKWHNRQEVFIRSLATRGSLGGLSPSIIGIAEVMKAASFDYIIVETVGVGQSEIEISRLADITIVVLVPESGDEIQTMKAGLMEIADIFVVNKSDRPDADLFARNLHRLLIERPVRNPRQIPVVKTIATASQGIDELYARILESLADGSSEEKKLTLLIEQAYILIQKKRMKDISREALSEIINTAMQKPDFNFYRLINAL